MKLATFLVLSLFLVHAQCHRTWIPNLLDHFANKTTQLTNMVRQGGKAFQKFYVDNIRSKFITYFRPSVKIDKEFASTISQGADLSRIRRNNKNKRYVSSTYPTTSMPYEPTLPGVSDDPAVYMTTPQLIASHGYRAESHTIVTDDGYILTVHRIPFDSKNGTQEDPRKTALLHHGLLGSSADWVLAGPNKSLAYILSDHGYDVWLANVRGNTYSRAHVTLPIDSYAFWNFTFHDVSQHDLPAVIDYIMETKGWNVKINYIGHSMGTTILFALLSTKTQYNKVLRAGYALAPVAYMSEIRSPIGLLARFANNIEYLMKLLGANEFLPQNQVLRWLSKYACEINHYEEAICENSVFVLCGHDEKEFNMTLLPVIFGHLPAGASTKTLIHYAQIIHNDGRFQQFDYGPHGNLLQYGTITPPEYRIGNITLPIALFTAENDWLSSDVDVTNLFVQLENPIEHYIVPMKEFNHVDFLWAVDAPKLVYNKLLKLLEGNSLPYFNPDMDSNEVYSVTQS